MEIGRHTFGEEGFVVRAEPQPEPEDLAPAWTPSVWSVNFNSVEKKH